MNCNVTYLDYSSQRLVSKTIICNIQKSITHRINLQHNGDYHNEWNSEELLNNIGNALFIIIPKSNIDYDNMKILLDKKSINTININNNSNIYINISINDKIGIINLINKHIQNI